MNVLDELLTCFSAWEPDVRVVGNVRAKDATEAITRLRAELAECKRQSVRLYNSGYHAGHHDTVEGCYTHILPCDMSTYHDDVVAALAAKGE